MPTLSIFVILSGSVVIWVQYLMIISLWTVLFHRNADQHLLHFEKIGKIRNLIDKHTTERLIHAFVVCHLDFCNSLLSGISARQVLKMQVVQNSAARLIYRIRKHESVFVVLRDLHWLHIHSRISFKVCC